MSARKAREQLLLIAHPSPDRYGSDLQLVATIDGAVAAGWRVMVVLPAAGPLVDMLVSSGAEVLIRKFPVLRKSLLTPQGIVRLTWSTLVAMFALARDIRSSGAQVMYVNTITIPAWLGAARLSGVPAVAHVHEAEEDQRRWIRVGMVAPLLLAREIVVNSAAAHRALVAVLPALARRITVVHNGVSGPSEPATPPAVDPSSPLRRLVVVGRLSPRKGIDVALEALALLAQEGRSVDLTVCGTVFPGYEWYEAELRARAARPDLAGLVTFAGYVSPTWPVLSSADVVLVPSRVEPFGNAAVEGLLACRPVVASDVQGLKEVIQKDLTGLLVPPGDPAELAEGIRKILDNPGRALSLAQQGQTDALNRFSLRRYHERLLSVIERSRSRPGRATIDR